MWPTRRLRSPTIATKARPSLSRSPRGLTSTERSPPATRSAASVSSSSPAAAAQAGLAAHGRRGVEDDRTGAAVDDLDRDRAAGLRGRALAEALDGDLEVQEGGQGAAGHADRRDVGDDPLARVARDVGQRL